MKSAIDYFCYGMNYWFKRAVLGKDEPFIGGMVITEKCNLGCEYCRVGGKDGKDLPYDDVINGMELFYKKGIRSLFFTGGEPFVWEDGNHRLEDMIERGRSMGFKVVTVYTNGTLEIETSADTVFVSLDSTKEHNNKLRGETFDRVVSNIEKSSHRNININATINSQNHQYLEKFCEFVSGMQNVNGIYFYFHTPYYGIDDLYLDLQAKRKVIERIVELKKKHNILNSYACLKSVYRDDWQRPSNLCCVYSKGKLFQCCRAVGDPEVCEKCGYMGYPELQAIMQLKPSALASAMNYLPRKRG